MTFILLIEDDPLLGAMIREMLETRDFEVSWVRNGVPVRRMLETGPHPELVLTDILMPEMDGFETLQLLREFCPGVPVIAMSAETTSGYLALARRMGALAVLQKPFSPAELFSAIGMAIEAAID